MFHDLFDFFLYIISSIKNDKHLVAFVEFIKEFQIVLKLFFGRYVIEQKKSNAEGTFFL